LISFETVVNLIGSTTTLKGLQVKSKLDESEYPKVILIKEPELKKVNLHPYAFNREWNYTIKTRKKQKS